MPFFLSHRSLVSDSPASALGAALFLVAGWPLAAVAQGAGTVTIYGIIDAATRYQSNANAARDKMVTMEDGVFTGSRLGFRVREDLGDGLAAVATLESGFDPSNGSSLQGTTTADYGQTVANPRFWGREIHVGLRSRSWGVTLGRQYTLAHSMTAKFQPQGNPNNQALSIFSSHHVARQDNVVRADIKLAGIDLSVTKTFGEVAGSDANGSWAAGAAYGGGPVWVGGYVQRLKSITGAEERKIAGLGGNYKATETLTLYAAGMRRTNAVSPQKNTVWTLAANLDVLPQIGVSVAYLADRQSGSTALTGDRKLAYITVNYMFSKRSAVYAVLENNRVSGGYAKPAFMGTKGDQTVFTFGARHRF